MRPHGGSAPSLRLMAWLKVLWEANISAFFSSKSSCYCQLAFGKVSNCTPPASSRPILPRYCATLSYATVSSHLNKPATASSSMWAWHFPLWKTHLLGFAISFSRYSSCHHLKGIIKSYFPVFAISQDIMLRWLLKPIPNRIGWVWSISLVGTVSPSKVLIFNGEFLASVGMSSHCAVSYFMRKMFEQESRMTFIACCRPFVSINAFPSGQGFILKFFNGPWAFARFLMKYFHRAGFM